MRENVSQTVKRSLTLVGALALAAAQPAITLGATPRGLPPARPPAAAPHAPARSGSVNQDDVRVPFHVDVQMKSLTVPQHFALQSSAKFSPLAPLPPLRRYGWQSTPNYLWYPAPYGPACYANNAFSGSPSEQQPTDVTLGSLVDGKSKLLSSPSHNPAFASGSDPIAASTSGVTFQFQSYPTACGAPAFTNF